MKVSDVMQREVDFVTTETSIREVSRLIFGRGINGVPVCDGRKLVGFVTERDILARFFPTMQEYMEDPVHSSDFEGMERKVSEILDLSAKEIMSRNPTSVTPDTPLLKAQSIMSVKKVGRLPVVDEEGTIVGIVSKGDIFKIIIGEKLPLEEEESFFDWFARHYDDVIDWKKRLSVEIPSLVDLFKKEKIRKVLDVASSTGEHTIALANKNYHVVGLEASSLMHQIAEKKTRNLSKTVRKNVNLLKGEYDDLISNLKGDFDSAIFMGNALVHVMRFNKNILKSTVNILSPKATLVSQLVNYDKVFRAGGLREFAIKKIGNTNYAFLRFSAKENGNVVFSFAVFESGKGNWIFRGIRSTPLVCLDVKGVVAMLKKEGFSKIEIYGSSMYGPLFKKSFDPIEDDWLNVVAKR